MFCLMKLPAGAVWTYFVNSTHYKVEFVFSLKKTIFSVNKSLEFVLRTIVLFRCIIMSH